MKTFIAIAAVLTAAALMAIVSTTPMAAFAEFKGGDESETNTEQNLKQKNVGSGSSTNLNCGTNNIDTTASITTCPTVEVG
jgi:anionic cell wall polymer biosynthesis LytR-Cps2A-Psr (LCP) family protein